jgi:hypothetical protein
MRCSEAASSVQLTSSDILVGGDCGEEIGSAYFSSIPSTSYVEVKSLVINMSSVLL